MLALSFSRQPLRPLHVALAHRLANTKPDDPMRPSLERLFSGLKPGEQMACRAEATLCRAAKRGEIEAEIVS